MPLEGEKSFLYLVQGFEDILLMLMPLGFRNKVRLENGTLTPLLQHSHPPPPPPPLLNSEFVLLA